METRCVKWNRSMFHSADRSYCVGLYMDTTTKQFFTCCGAELPEGNVIYRFTGEETENKKYGKQFLVQSYEVASDSKTNLIAYLSSSDFAGIGKGTAKKIVKELGVADTRELVGGRIELIQNLSLSEKKKTQLETVLRSTSELVEVKRELMPYGVPEKLCKKLVSLYHEDAIAVVRRNPYILSVISEKIGFRKADEIAMKMGVPPDANVRIAAGIREVLMQDTLRGHFYSLRRTIAPETTRLLGISNAEKVDDAFEQLKQTNKVVATEKVVYSKTNFTVESGIAKLLLRIWQRGNMKPLLNPMLMDNALSDAEKQLGFSLPDKQREAVQTAILSPISIITGGAGTGKTTILKAIQSIIDRHAKQFSYLFAAPTGKAARRISESTSSEASTIHRMLGLTEGSSDPMGIDADIVICDESSMIDAALFHKLLQGMLIGKAHHLILVGDVEQLPSVGAGAVLNDLIKSKQIPVVVLNTTYRQAKDSGIIENANLVRNGDTNIRFNDEDFIFVQCDSPEKIAEEVRRLYAQNPENACVLAPRKGGIAGVNNLNNILRETVNPLSTAGTEKQYGDFIFRVGDKVMQIKNTDDGLSNGDTGIITAIVQDEVKVKFDCGMDGSYTGDELEKIIPSFAMTIHKSQGSQFPTVILALSSSESRMMLKKNLLYTGITRAQKKVYIVGDEQAIRTAILTPDTSVRHTALDVRVRRAWCEQN